MCSHPIFQNFRFISFLLRMVPGSRALIFPCLFVWMITPGAFAQKSSATLSGTVKDKNNNTPLPFVSLILRSSADSSFVSGTITNERGLFTLTEILPGDYLLATSRMGYSGYSYPLFVGGNSEFLDLGILFLEENLQELREVVVNANAEGLAAGLDKKTYTLSENISQTGGSVLQSMNNLPGITTQEGKIFLRGNDQIMILLDGKQTAITGFGNQSGLDNIPASAVERIEIINNPSAKFDANGNAGIINIILKKEDQNGWNGKVGLTTGLGALWIRQENLPGIRPQYQTTPKLNPSLSLNHRKNKVNLFLQADNLYTETLNKNEFVTRTYAGGKVIHQQLKRNRDTNFFTSRAGVDWLINDQNTLTISGFYSQETIIDRGDQPFFSGNSGQNLRLWQFLEDEVLSAAMASVAYEHKFQQPGHKLAAGFNYTFDREDEKYFFTNTTPEFSTQESFFLIADQTVADFTLDYTRPLKQGILETGLKFRKRTIPTDMQFNPSSENSVLDTGADGNATYRETIPALYGTYIYDTKKWEAEIGLRLEYVDLFYEVDPNHNTYQSDGYTYFQPFPNARFSYILNERNKLSAFVNRRVDRPDEVDIRIFPKYDDAEIIKVGNPGLQPQFTTNLEVGYRHDWPKGYFYGAAYRRMADGTITRIASTDGNSTLIYNIAQNAGKSSNSGLELVLNQAISEKVNVNLNLNGYFNQIDEFTVLNQYPVEKQLSFGKQEMYSGNIKLNTNFKMEKDLEVLISAIYLAPDIIPQGKIRSRFSMDAGIKKLIQNKQGEIFFNATDLLNTLVIQKEIQSEGFSYTSSDYLETQVIRLGYSYKF